MKELYNVSINRTANETFGVYADSLEEAEKKAVEEAMNHDWASCGDVIYDIVETEKE